MANPFAIPYPLFAGNKKAPAKPALLNAFEIP